MRKHCSRLCLTLLLCMLPVLALGDGSFQTLQLGNATNEVTLLRHDDSGLRLNLDIGTVDFAEVITKEGAYNLVAVHGLSRSQRVGEPSLPMASRMIAIPFGCQLRAEIISSDVEEIKLSDLGITTQLMPVQPPVSKSDDPASLPFHRDNAIYEMTGFYQSPMVEAHEVGIMRGVRMGRVEINPFEYNPAEGILRIHKNVEVEITFENADWYTTDEMWAKYYSPVFEPVHQRVINYNEMFSGDRANLLTYPIGFIILSDRMFEAQLQPFIEWKTRKGFAVHVAYFDVIGTDRTDVKNYLDSLYTNMTPAPSMALIVGDAQQLDPWDGSGHVTDLYFFEFTGDLFPEMWYGRFSAQNTTELQPQIDKTLEYEQYLMPDPAYLEEVTLVAGVDGTYAITHGNGQINYGTSLYYNAAHGISPNVWLYPASAGSVSADIIQTVSDGVALYNYTAHCNHEGHGNPSFVKSDIPGLTNHNKYLLGIGNCCLPNTFDESTPCFGEAFLQVSGKGGIGYIGATDNTQWDPDYWWGVGAGAVVGSGPAYEDMGPGAYDGIFHDHGEPESAWYIVNGAISPAGNFGVSDAGSSSEQYYWEVYHLMGDPSLMTYIGVPDINNVVHDATMLMTATNLTVNADPASYVGITYEGVLVGAGYIGTSGQATIPVSGITQPGTAEIVVTAQFKQPYIDSIQVITPSGPYVIYDYSDYNEAVGNGNGVIDAGESFTMGIGLVNVGPDDAVNVEAFISTTDINIAITDSTDSYGTILADNGTGYVANGFAFDVAYDAPDGTRAVIDLEITGENRESWFGSFQIAVHAPVLEVLAVSVDDSGGDNNGILDPGETASLMVTLRNTGTGQAFSAEAYVSETDPNVSFGNDYSYYGNIDSVGGTANNSGQEFVITALEECPLGYAVPIQVAVTGDNGLNTTLGFNITIGDRVAFFSDDFSYDQGWTGLGGAAEWEIGSPTGSGGDPSEDNSPSSDNFVLGNDLSGTYNNGISTTQWAYSPVLDCGTMSGVQMTYYHWLGMESSDYDHAYFDVYDGTAWVRLFENGGTNQETEWTYEFYDLSAIADGNPEFQLRWGLGSTDGSATYSGWNIDDIEIKGYGTIGLPQFEMTQAPIIDTVQPGGTINESMMIKNTGEGTLRVWFDSGDNWLEFSPETQVILPGDSLEFVLTLNSDGLACGTHAGNLHFTTNDDNTPEGNVAVTLTILAPDLDITETFLEEDLEAGQQSTYPLTIYNNGPGRLDYQIGRTMFSSKDTRGTLVTSSNDPVGTRPADSDKSDATEPFYAPLDKGFGGPDDFGHSWIDSDETGGPAFDWVDISTVGTALTLGDDESSPALQIGFGFPLYDSVYTELYISSNGLIAFDEVTTSRINTAFPDTTTITGVIALVWDDLDPRQGGQILYYHDAANGRFIVSYNDIAFYYSPSGTGLVNAQLHLYDNGTIQMHYGTIEGGEHGLESLSIGLQNSEQIDGLTVLYNAAYLHSNMAVAITADQWLSVAPAGGSIDPFGSDIVNVAYDASELADGTYNGQLLVSCNDPITPSYTIPVTLTVAPEITYICGDINGDGNIVVGIDDLVYLVTYMFDQGPPPPVMAAANVDGEPGITITDLVYMVEFMFNSGPPLNCVE